MEAHAHARRRVLKLPPVRLSGQDLAFLQCTSQQNNHQRADLTPWCYQMPAPPVAHPFHHQQPMLVHPVWAGYYGGASWQWQQYGAECQPFTAPQCKSPSVRRAPEPSPEVQRKRALRQEANREAARKSKQRQRDKEMEILTKAVQLRQETKFVRKQINRMVPITKNLQVQNNELRRELRLPCHPQSIVQEPVLPQSVDIPKELDVILSDYEKQMIEDVLLKRKR